MARWTFTDAIGNWARDRRGNFAILTGVTISMLAMGVGFGVNTAQMMNTRSALLSALDAAVTSTARDLTTGLIEEKDAEEMVTAFLLANVGDGFATKDRVTLEKLEVDRTANTVSAGAVAVIDLAFPLFSTGETQEVRVESAAVYSDRQIEVAMMLDVTGSMAGWKIEDLKDAATSAVEDLLRRNRPGNERVRVALVPYANSVNAGALAASSVYVERSYAERRQAEGNTAPRPVGASTRPDNCATERKGAHRFTDAGPGVSMVNRDFLIDEFIDKYERGDESRTCPNVAVMPLTHDQERLTRAINRFKAVGRTAGHIGVQWSWYMLSERWASALPTASRPARPSEDVAKFAILMTDGEFNLSYFDAKDVGDVYDDRGKRQTRESAKRLCREMRESGIEIFTIGFDLDDDDARETMAACASPDTGAIRHFFDTANGEELEAAFLEITGNIETLALTR